MIRVADQVEPRVQTKALDHALQQVLLCERITIARYEQHRDVYARKMLSAFDPGLTGGMQREAQECEAAHSGEGFDRLGLRGHAPAERATTGKEREIACQCDRRSGRSP